MVVREAERPACVSWAHNLMENQESQDEAAGHAAHHRANQAEWQPREADPGLNLNLSACLTVLYPNWQCLFCLSHAHVA